MATDLQAQLVEVAGESAQLAGKLSALAQEPVPAPVVAAPRPRAPARPKLTVLVAVTGEDLAAQLGAELARLYPEDVLTVRYVPPAVLVDYLPLRLKLTIRHQHALAGGAEEFMVEQSSGPRGLFRGKTGSPGEIAEYVVRFFKRLKSKPAEVVAAPPAGGKRRKVKRQRPAAKKRRAPSFAALVRAAQRRIRARRRG